MCVANSRASLGHLPGATESEREHTATQHRHWPGWGAGCLRWPHCSTAEEEEADEAKVMIGHGLAVWASASVGRARQRALELALLRRRGRPFQERNRVSSLSLSHSLFPLSLSRSTTFALVCYRRGSLAPLRGRFGFLSFSDHPTKNEQNHRFAITNTTLQRQNAEAELKS